jgi:hypothetical protein
MKKRGKKRQELIICKPCVIPKIHLWKVFMKQQHPVITIIIDVRIWHREFKGEKIIGAVEIPLPELFQHFDSLPRDKKIDAHWQKRPALCS